MLKINLKIGAFTIMPNKLKPDYYSRNGKDLLDHFKEMFSPEMYTGFLTGNVIKYVIRWQGKNGLEDLNKAKVYLDKLIDYAKQGDKK